MSSRHWAHVSPSNLIMCLCAAVYVFFAFFFLLLLFPSRLPTCLSAAEACHTCDVSVSLTGTKEGNIALRPAIRRAELRTRVLLLPLPHTCVFVCDNSGCGKQQPQSAALITCVQIPSLIKVTADA